MSCKTQLLYYLTHLSHGLRLQLGILPLHFRKEYNLQKKIFFYFVLLDLCTNSSYCPQLMEFFEEAIVKSKNAQIRCSSNFNYYLWHLGEVTILFLPHTMKNVVKSLLQERVVHTWFLENDIFPRNSHIESESIFMNYTLGVLDMLFICKRQTKEI